MQCVSEGIVASQVGGIAEGLPEGAHGRGGVFCIFSNHFHFFGDRLFKSDSLRLEDLLLGDGDVDQGARRLRVEPVAGHLVGRHGGCRRCGRSPARDLWHGDGAATAPLTFHDAVHLAAHRVDLVAHLVVGLQHAQHLLQRFIVDFGQHLHGLGFALPARAVFLLHFILGLVVEVVALASSGVKVVEVLQNGRKNAIDDLEIELVDVFAHIAGVDESARV